MRQDDVNLFFVRLERRTMRMNMETQANDDLKLKVCNCNTVSHPFGFLTPIPNSQGRSLDQGIGRQLGV